MEDFKNTVDKLQASIKRLKHLTKTKTPAPIPTSFTVKTSWRVDEEIIDSIKEHLEKKGKKVTLNAIKRIAQKCYKEHGDYFYFEYQSILDQI